MTLFSPIVRRALTGALLVAGALGLGLAAVPATPVSASAPVAVAGSRAPAPVAQTGATANRAIAATLAQCGGSGPNTIYGPTMFCSNVSGTPLYAAGTVLGTGTPIDHVRTTTSWFVCRRDIPGMPNGEGQPHPDRWEWTQGDDHGNFGWAPDSWIFSETNPLPTC